jgi:hypothetical protein
MKIFIPGNVPSLKNSKQLVPIGKRCGKCGKGKFYRPIPSAKVREWNKITRTYFDLHRSEFLKALSGMEKPYRIKFRFVRGTRHKFDYTNALDTVQDQMVNCHWLEDDNCTILLPVVLPYKYSKVKPGVWIKL